MTFSTGGLSNSLYGQFKHFSSIERFKKKFLSQSSLIKNYTKDMTEEQREDYIEECNFKVSCCP